MVKLVAFLAVGGFVTWGLFDGMADIWSRAQAFPELRALLRLGGEDGAGSFGYAQWFALTLLSMLSVLLLPRQFQMMVVECVDERHLRRAAWAFPAYLLLINVFVLPIAIGGLVLFGPGRSDAETFVLSLPLAHGAPALALFAYVGGLSAATGMLIVETIAVSTMVCNDLVMPSLLRLPGFGARAAGDLTRLLLNIRRAAILVVLLLGYLYFHVAGEAYALVSIGLISFAAVAQFGPALLVGMYWRGGTRAGALGGLLGGFTVWVYTLMLPSVAKSGWIPAGFVEHGPFGIELLAPEQLFGLVGLDNLTHSLFWSLLVNLGLYVGLSLRRAPSARDASQALLFVDVFERGRSAGVAAPVFWRGRARLEDLVALATRLLGAARARQLFEDHARETGVAEVGQVVPDARLVDRVERQLAGAVGSASARVMVASVVQEEPLAIDDVIEILDEASQVRGYARALEEKSRSLEAATAELREANEQLQSLDHLKDDFMSSVTHELRTPLTSIRALSELMLDTPDMEAGQREEFLTIVVSESERLSRLVNQVLDMAKIESGHAEWHNTDVDMRTLVANAVRAASELFREHGTVVEAVPARPTAADPRRSRPADPSHAEPALQRREVRSRGGREGRGRAAHRRGRPDRQCPRQRPRGAGGRTGDGVREVPPGRGCPQPAAGDGTWPSDQPPDRRSFRRAHVAGIGTGRGRVLRIPAADPADGGQGRIMSHKVLIADDEPNIVVSLEFMMKREGYEVVVARDGLQALEAIRRERPQLVLLDAMMPGMSGFDVCEAVRADEAVRDTRILMLTAKGRDTDVARGTGVGADAYVTKPFSTRDLMQKVRDMLA